MTKQLKLFQGFGKFTIDVLSSTQHNGSHQLLYITKSK